MKVIVLIALATLAIAETPGFCDFAEGFGKSFNGEECGWKTETVCTDSFQIWDAIAALFKGEWNKVFEMIGILTSFFDEWIDAWNECQVALIFKDFFPEFWTIVKQWPEELWESWMDMTHMMEAIHEANYQSAGEILGTLVKKLVSNQ